MSPAQLAFSRRLRSEPAETVFDRLCTLVRVEPGFEGPWAGDRLKIVLRDTLRADSSCTGAWAEETWEQLSEVCNRRFP